jgi:ABC-type polysaccharide/polyol phosphate transport system ATPase subunit
MPPSAAIRLDAVSVRYRLAHHRISSVKDYAIHWMRGALVYDELLALDAVSLVVAPGESVGVIGGNGAGKSTLLKVVSRVLKPAAGTVAVAGRVAPLLELGAGFDHELTGLENVYLNGLLLGRTRAEVGAVRDEVVDFSGLAKFIDSPVRSWSNGMRARLGFAIATAWVPEVLLIDEVLAVGDAAFMRQCEERLAEFRRRGTTVVLVSHDLDAVRDACSRCVWLDGGRIVADAAPEAVIARYLGARSS